jgi:sigma-B regulation protein RsbU (phosphoserine phosphatase)
MRRHKLHRGPIRVTLLGHIAAARLVRRVPARPAPPAEPVVSLEDLKRQAEDLKRQAEIEQELSMARDIQQGLLLEAVPRLPGWEITAISLPARDLGGDLYDFLPFGNNIHGLMIADVSGKGLPAALRMAVARTVFRHEARLGNAPGFTLAAVNRSVIGEIPQGMITMLYATLDTACGRLRVANAGHNYPVLINGQVGEVEISGLPLGVDLDSDYEEIGAEIAPGDTVLLYTDGVVEAVNHAEEIYGYERLERLLRSSDRLRPRSLTAALLQELRAWSGTGQSDDVTVVVIRRRLARVGAELRGLAEEVLGVERAGQLWEQLPAPSDEASPEEWASALPGLMREAQARFGRGLARELNGQLRPALEEYRQQAGEPGANHDR